MKSGRGGICRLPGTTLNTGKPTHKRPDNFLVSQWKQNTNPSTSKSYPTRTLIKINPNMGKIATAKFTARAGKIYKKKTT